MMAYYLLSYKPNVTSNAQSYVQQGQSIKCASMNITMLKVKPKQSINIPIYEYKASYLKVLMFAQLIQKLLAEFPTDTTGIKPLET